MKLIDRFKWIILISCCCLLLACEKNKKQEQAPAYKTITAKEDTMVNPLFFNGTINPKSITNVNSPIDGVVSDQYFIYGHFVKEKAPLYTIVSEQLEKDFLTSISDYMKAIDEYTKANRKYIGSQELWKLKFISENEYYSDKTTRDESYFSMRQSAFNVRRMLEKLGIEINKVKHIDLTNKAVIENILAKKKDKMQVISPIAGVALVPSKSSGDTTSGGDTVEKGSEIKTGQIMVAIGDMTGLSVKIEVNEVDINQIKVQQKAQVTGSAFPGETLNGYVSNIDTQAKASGTSIPTFAVTVVIPSISKEQQQKIYVGMSSKVEILIEEKNVFILPLNAVFQENGVSMVKVKDPKTGQIKAMPIVTGKTTMQSISVLKGIKTGDIIVYDN